MPAFLGGASSGSSNTNPHRETITQSNTFVAGDVVKFDGTTYSKAQGNTLANSRAVGVVESASSTQFTLVRHGEITLSGLTAGSIYYLSTSVAGGTTTTEPTTVGLISKVIFFAITTARAFVLLEDGDVITAPSAATAGKSVKLEETVGGGIVAGDVIYYDGAAWQKSKADAVATSEVWGVVESVAGGVATIVTCGEITIGSASWTPGAVYFLSPTTAGLLTTTEPTSAGHITKPLMYATTATKGLVLHMRGLVIPTTPSNYDGFNYVVNGAYDHWTPGTSFSTPASGTETADGWTVLYDGTIGTFTVSRQTFSPGQTDVTGDQAYHFRWAHTGASAGSTYHRVRTNLGNVRTLANKIITVSLWLKLGSAATVATRLVQYFGSGGAPSSDVNTNVGSHSVTTSWSRFSASVTVPSIFGKTIGNSGDALYLELILPINTTFTLDVANVQVEVGQTPSDFVRRLHTPTGDLLLI